jgi:cytochrome d ubiquinol oxidase subunit II
VTAADLILLVIVGALTAYLVLGGADFGGGLWDLFAVGRTGARQRALISRTLGPVWEANHVWLILALVATFSAFPPVYAAIGRGLALPVSIALVGIVLRGAGYVYRAYGQGAAGGDRLWGRVFAIASVIAPYMLGEAAAGLATGEMDAGAALLGRPFAILVGALTVAATAFLAATYLAHEADVGGDEPLARVFRWRALAGAVITGLLALALVPTLRADAPRLADHLDRAVPFIAVSALAGLGALVLLWRSRYRLARVPAALAVACVLWGWAAAQYPYLIAGQDTISQASAPANSLRATALVLVAGLALLAPGTIALFRVFARPPEISGAHGEDP